MLVVPLWPLAHFWPLIAHKFSRYLVAHTIHIGNEVLTHGRNFNLLLGSDLFTENIIALRLLLVEISFKRDTLTQLGYNPNDYGLHSLRSGAITAAVCNSRNSIPD